jgi:hypothetical protein
LVLLDFGKYHPWFKEMLLPLDEEGIITFCGERYVPPSDEIKTPPLKLKTNPAIIAEGCD